MDAKEIRELTNKCIDLRLEAISYLKKMEELFNKIRDRLRAQNIYALYGEDCKITNMEFEDNGDIMFQFCEELASSVNHIPYFYISDFVKNWPADIKEVLKPVIIEVFLYEKLFKKCEELESEAKDLYKKYGSYVKQAARVNVYRIWKRFSGLKYYKIEYRLAQLESMKNDLENLSDEELISENQ